MPGCHTLGGQWRSGTIPLVQSYLKTHEDILATRLPSCNDARDPYCESRTRVETGVSTYFKTIMIWQCHVFMLNNSDPYTKEEIEAARKEACTIGKILTKLSKETDTHGSQISNLPTSRLLDASKLDDFCSGPKLKLIRRVPEGLEEVEDNIEFYGGPFYVEAIFEDAPQDSEKTVRVKISAGNSDAATENDLEIKVQRTEESNVFRSEEFHIFAEETQDISSDSARVRP